MKIIRIERHGVDELITGLRRVTMLTQPDVFVYRDSCISLARIRPECLAPPQSYVLKSELLKVRQLRWELQSFGVDLFHLEGYVTIYLEGCEDPIDVLPPVVEESIEADGTVHLLVCDGMHRVYLARLEHVVPQVIYIRGLPPAFPYYAYPFPGGWANVELRDDLPEGYIKKWHRIPHYKSLYRNFNSAFNNVGGPRGHFVRQGTLGV